MYLWNWSCLDIDSYWDEGEEISTCCCPTTSASSQPVFLEPQSSHDWLSELWLVDVNNTRLWLAADSLLTMLASGLALKGHRPHRNLTLESYIWMDEETLDFRLEIKIIFSLQISRLIVAKIEWFNFGFRSCWQGVEAYHTIFMNSLYFDLELIFVTLLRIIY